MVFREVIVDESNRRRMRTGHRRGVAGRDGKAVSKVATVYEAVEFCCFEGDIPRPAA
jgi:hypothetical protein